jgi:transcriptional regulator with XRE-family HTH domain
MANPNRIRWFRTAQHMTQRELAARVGLRRSELQRLERGREDVPDAVWAELAGVFGVSVPYLKGSDDPSGDDGQWVAA